eukprot:618110-Rhodomonas_salina.1
MEVNLDKTVLTAYDFGSNSTPIDVGLITFKGQGLKTIQHTASYPYLGYELSLSGDWTAEFEK